MIRLRKRVAVLLAAILALIVTIACLWIRLDAQWFPTYPYALSRNPVMKDTIEPPEELISRPGPDHQNVNATLLSLVRNSELKDLINTMKDVERTFNSKFNYPWTFLNDEPFSEEFKTETSKLTKAKVHYEVVPPEHWLEPSWINGELQNASEIYLKSEKVQYSLMKSYHRMCRWNSGMFFHHPRLKEFRWYWRVEPKTQYFCDIDYDVFKFMEDTKKAYGFNINLYDSPQSIRTLWPTTLEFISEYPEFVHENSSIGWLTDSSNRPEHNRIAQGYSTCHFWSNFEIADMDFWRSEAYQKYFDHLDRSGGFFYERWGDAPVHSIAAGLFLDQKQIHWFKDIGYHHSPYFNCPNSPKCKGCVPGLFSKGKDVIQENCLPIWAKYGGLDHSEF
ncbi:probable mannosyltransferase Ktr4p [Trichomonascus vanleenenianus]|uniref:glycosyltransferase family 15 protein n=1 Tax=Trichomonascus vanleenenianus TaxID=2268995 RepID=UPI003ECB5EA0